MAYIFDSWPHKVYDKTFLKDVRLSIFFPKIERIVGKEDALKGFFKEFFKIDMQMEKFLSVLHVKSEDEDICLDFKMDSVEIVMRRPAYKSFLLTEAMMKAANTYMRTLGVERISSVEFVKYNELEYKLPNDKMGIMEVMKGVFKDNLIEPVYADGINDLDTYMKSLTRWEKVITKDDDESGSIFNIEYGFSRKNSNSLNGILALKTRIETNGDGIDFAGLDAKIALFNRILDDAFHWCVRQEVIAMMEAKAND